MCGGSLRDNVRRRIKRRGTSATRGRVRWDDERFVREVCKDNLPCTFELKCVRRYPMTEAEIQEQELRDREEEERVMARQHRSRSRATSRAGSSRPPTRPASRASRVVDDDSSETS